jgi:crotonobetainyl-CoA:carnitine CoA-transferase CaiB-like acyl-CoA transferase
MTAQLPLEGIRVLDLGGVWAGTFSTLLLADQGAEVLKQENQFVWQPNTRAVPGPNISSQMTQAGPGWITGFPNSEPGPRPWNYHPMFVSLYRNKRSFTLDIRNEKGHEILGELAKISDVVIENSAVGTMEKLGVSYEWLKELNPGIIFLRAPGYGLTGDYVSARTMGSHLEGVIGHQLLRGYRNEGPDSNSAIFSADYIAGTQIAFAVMSAIWERKKTGKGQFIEMAQAENAIAMFAQGYMQYAITGTEPDRVGNQSIYPQESPTGIYPCKPEGDGDPAQGKDRWIAISISTDSEWKIFRTEMGNPEWAISPQLEQWENRYSQHDELDKNIAEWTQKFTDYELFHKLQKAGVPAAPVLDASRVPTDEHVQERALYSPQTLQDPIGEFPFPTPLFDFPAANGGIRRPPVAMGQDNEYVYRELLGINDEDWDLLEAEGHIATRFNDSLM